MSWPLACTARKKLRPIRPNPLMPTRTVTAAPHVDDSVVPETLSDRAAPGGTRAEGPEPRRVAVTAAALRRALEHLRGHVGFGVGDAEIGGSLVGHRQQPPDPPGDCVLGHRRVREGAELL